jgi:integrase
MKIHISERNIAKLKTPGSGSKIYYDDQVRGFGVRLTSNGVISFVLNYSINGRERRYTLARCPEQTAAWAREEALRLRGEIRNHGADPLEQRDQRATEPTISELADDYLERHARPHKRASSVREDEKLLKIVLPRIGEFRVGSVNRRDIEALHRSLKGTPYRANRLLALLSKMFSLAIGWQWRADNPTKGIPRFHEDKRETWLTAEQLEHLKKALADYGDQSAADAIRLLILTGAREGEVLKASWEQFDLKRGIWTKPSHHTKQKRIEHVPLSRVALDLLTRMDKGKAGPHLFPGRFQNGSRVTLRRPWVQVCKAAGLATAVELQGKRSKLVRYRPTIRIHDLRHTFASHLVSSGESLHIVGKLLGHTQPQTTARYAHLADSTLREAVNNFGRIFEMKRKTAPRAAAGGTSQ